MPGRADCCGSGTSFDSKRWLSLDPCGFFCVSCSFGVHIYATTVIGLFLISDSLVAQIVYGAVYLPVTFLAVWSLFKAWRTDPGAIPMGARPLTTVKMAKSTSNVEEEEDAKPSKKPPTRAIRRCHKCNDNYKPNRAHHDSVTGRCIVKFDHYCPWVGNAVGALNHKFFVLFIGYTICACLISIMIIFFRLFHCGAVHGEEDEASESVETTEADWHEPENKKSDETRMLQDYVYPDCNYLFGSPFCIILMIVSVTFLIFTCCMMVEQIDAIESNQSKIARMKLKVGQGGTELERVSHDFNEMFGGNSPHPTWHWFLPLSVKFPSGMEKVVMGYEWDPTFGDEPFQENDLVAAIKGEPKTTAEDALDLEAGGSSINDTASEMSDTPSLTESPNNSLHSTGTKKRTTKSNKQNPKFVDRTKGRLT